MRVALAAILGLLLGAVLAWSIGVFVLKLHWETTLLAMEVVAVVFAVVGGVVTHRATRRQSQQQITSR